MITVKLNVTKLEHNLLTTPKGTECIVIPIKENNLFKSEKGNIFLDLVGFELKEESKFGDTHLMKQSLSKEVREKMSEEEQKAIPILGNAKINSNSQTQESTPNNAGVPASSVDDLPF